MFVFFLLQIQELCLSPSLSLSLSLSVSLCPSPSLSFSVVFCLSVSLSLSLCLALSRSLSMSLSVSLCLSLSLSLSVALSLSLSACLSSFSLEVVSTLQYRSLDKHASRQAKLTFDDTSTCQILQYIGRYWDPLKRQNVSILVGGGHDITGAEESQAHIIVDIDKEEHRVLIADFPDSKFTAPRNRAK